MDYSKKQQEKLVSEFKDLKMKYDELKASYEKDIPARRLEEEKLLKRTSIISAFNQYSIELEEQEKDTVSKFIVNSFKKLFEVRAVWISSYSEETHELIIESSTATDEENSRIMRYLGLALHRYRTSVNDEQLDLILSSRTKMFSSLHEISFGQIPQLIGKSIEKIFDVGWFLGVALIDRGKLYGTLVIAGYKKQDELQPDIVKIFSDLTSTVLRRKEAEHRLIMSEDKFRKAFFTSPDSININRLEDGLYVSINHGFTKITGYSEEDVIGKTSVELNIWADPSDRDNLIKGLREKGEVENLEARFRMKNGSVIIGIMSAAIINLDNVPHILSVTRDMTERKKMELEIRNSDARFRELIDLAPDGILLGSKQGELIVANSKILNITGRPLKDLIGGNLSSLLAEEEMARVPLRYDLLENGETVSRIRSLKRPDGTVVSIEMITKMMPDGTYMSIWHDITKRQLAEAALIRSKEQYDDLVSKIPVGIYLLRSHPDKSFTLDFVSPRMAEMIDLSVEKMIADARNIYEKIYPEDKENFINSNEEGIRLCQPFDWTGRIVYKKTIKWLHISSTPEVQTNGDVLWHGIMVDITEQKLAESSLVENERLLRDTQILAMLGSFVWDLKSDQWKSSTILDEIFGIDKNFTRSFKGWVSLIHPDFKKLMTDYVREDILVKHHKFDKEYRIVRPADGQVRWVHGISELEFDKNKQPIKLIGTIIDITDRKNADDEIKKLNVSLEKRVIERTAQLEAANHELQAFAYSVSHDLRAPLRAIDGFSKFVIEDYGSKLDSEGQRLLGLIRSNTQKMDKLITDILALSRVTRGEQKKSKIDMTKMAVSMFNEAAQAEVLEKLDFNIDDLPGAYADPTYIKQVWINLISNAIKFSSLKAKPEIKIGGYSDNGYNIYFIRDNGAGFNPEYAHKLFGVFQRLHKANEFEGTGVGLAIVQRIILKHGGKVWADGEEDRGATFYFSLPALK